MVSVVDGSGVAVEGAMEQAVEEARRNDEE